MRAFPIALLVYAVLVLSGKPGTPDAVPRRVLHPRPGQHTKRQERHGLISPLGDRLPSHEDAKRQAASQNRRLCVVQPRPDGGDDAPALMDALNHGCRTRSVVYLPGPVYNIRTAMTTLHLEDVKIVLLGRLLWSPDIQYWRSVSMPVGFQNQSTVWYFGGNKVWYDWAKGEGNLARRPMNINYRRLTNSVVRRMRFVQSQMWTMAITHSKNVDLDDIYVNSTSNSQWNTLNTDGCDTIYSDRITFRRWFVSNGDDSIALKGNSSNIAIYDSTFVNGQGVAIGSMGQYDGRFEYITDFLARNITLRNTAHVSYLKTWSGHSRGFPPNGGGGGLGHASNIIMEDIRIQGLRQEPFFAWQCENYSGFAGKDCNSSKFKLNNVGWHRVTGSVRDNVKETGHFQCSAGAGGCDEFKVSDIRITRAGRPLNTWHCENVHRNAGFQCNV